MGAMLEQINLVGLKFVEFALPMFVQSVVLILILLLADFALRKRVRAVFRYWIWLLVLVKLVLPTSLSSPMSLGYFFGNRLTYVDTTETLSEPQAQLIEPAPVNVPPFIDLTDIEPHRFTQAAPPPITVTEQVKEPAMTNTVAPQVITVTPLSWRGAVFLVWLTVVIAMVLLLLQRAIVVRGLIAQAKEANGVMADMLESCRISMSVKRKHGLKISANAASPAVCGLFRPVILVPQNLAKSLTVNQLRAVLLHELAHIRRGDLFVNLAQTVLQIIYFYNPLLWLANCIIRRIREQAVDEMVLVAMGEKAPQYPQTLVSVAKLAFKQPVLSLRLIGVVESKSALSGRIKHILNRPIPKKAKLGIFGLLVVIIIGAILLPMAKGSWGQKGRIDKLVEKLSNKDDAVWEPAAEQLKKIGPKVARQVAELFRTAPGDLHAIRVLESMATDEHVQNVMVQGLSADPHLTNSNVRHCSLIILSKSDNRDHVKRIIPLLRKDVENGEDYSMAAIALSELGGDDAYNALVETVTKDIPDQLRWMIAEHLAAMGRPEAAPHLKDALKLVNPSHPSAGARIVEAIHRLEDKNEIVKKPYPNYDHTFTLYEFDSKYSQRGILYAYDLQRANDAGMYVDKPPAGANAEETISGGLRALAASSKGDLIFERVGEQTRLQTYHGTLLAPLEGKFEPPHYFWTDAIVKMNQSELKQLVLDYNNKHAKDIAGSIPSFRLYPFDEGDMFAAVLPSGQIAILATEKIESYTSGVRLSVLYLDPLLALVGTGRIEASQESTTDADKTRFIATLPNGVTVELIGVCEHPSEGKQWWRPDGSKLNQRPFEKLAQRIYTKHEYYELALKIENPANRKLSVISKDGRIFNLCPDKIWGGVVFSEGKKILNQSIGIAYGQWETIVEAYPKLTQLIGDFAFSKAFESDVEGIGTAVGVTVTHNIGKEKVDYRVIAVDNKNNIHTSSGRSGISGGSWMQTTVHFKDLKINEIKEFQFQTRPYDWIEFKNISLEPNFKTDMRGGPEEAKSEIPQPIRNYTNTNREYFWRVNIKQARDKELLKTLNETIEPFEERVGFYIRDYNDGVIHCIDFDKNRIIRVPDELNIKDRDAILKWARENEVDAMFRRASSLASLDMASVIVSDSEWKKLSGNTLKKLDEKTAGSTDALYSSGNGIMFHAFKTSQGRIGVMKLSSLENNELDHCLLLISYKLLKIVVQAEAIEAIKESDTQNQKLSFGPVIELDIPLLVRDDDIYQKAGLIDFETGRLFRLPQKYMKLHKELEQNEYETQVREWCRENGIDAGAVGVWFIQVNAGGVGLGSVEWAGKIFLKVSSESWNFMDPEELLIRLQQEQLKGDIGFNEPSEIFAFRTIEGNVGLLKALSLTESSIKIRYKLLDKKTALESNVPVGPEPVVGDWQYIGQSIPPDFNDTMILTEHINLDSIGRDAEGKTFITFIRDGQQAQNRQYRFVLFTKDGDILEPDGQVVLGEGKRLEEKFTFDEPFITRQLKGFRFQARPSPPSRIDNISSGLQKVAPEVVKNGTFLPSDLAPPGRYAVELDGVDDYLLVPDSPSLRLEPPFTIEMWIKTKLPPDANEYRGGWALISKGFAVGTPRAYLTGFGINLQRFPKEPSNLHIDFCKANNSGTYSATYAGYPLKNGVSEWIHITHVFNGKYYKSTPGHPLVMGKFLIPINDPFQGLLGEVRLWNGARTRQELRQYENIALTGNEPHLAACWTFEQTKGQYALDISGNNNHARLGKFTGPDYADPKWVDLQVTSSQPDQKSDLQVEDKKRETEISGFVVDENGSPIAGATVTLLNKDLVLLPKPERLGQTMRMIIFDHFYDITDTNGRFEFLDFNPGKTDIIVKSHGYRTEILRGITTGTKNLRITLGKPSAYTLAGEVVDSKGDPISGVEITLAEESYTTVRTDEKGEFRFVEILEPTAVHRARALFARKEGFGIWGKTLDTTGGETYVKITLLPEEKISGRVVDQIGKPIANATILFWSCRGRDTDFGFSSKWQEIAPRAETDANGRFTLSGIPTESDVCIRALAMGYASSALYSIKTGKFGSYAIRKKDERGTFVYGSNREPAETIEFKLQKAVTLLGTLTYEDTGRPVPGMKIATQSHRASRWAETWTDQAGRFKLEGVSPNPCNLLVVQEDSERDSLPEWTSAAIQFDDLQEGETRSGIRLVLTKGGVIRGKAVDAQGNPLHGIDIAFYSAARPRPGAACQVIYTAKDGSWAYRFPPGDVYVYIRTKIPEGSWSKKIYNLHLDDGQVIDNIDFELSQAVPENSPYRREIALKADLQVQTKASLAGKEKVIPRGRDYEAAKSEPQPIELWKVREYGVGGSSRTERKLQTYVKRQYPVQLVWPLIQDASKYVVQIHGLRGSRPAESFESITNHLRLNASDIAPGRYQWSVSVYDEKGKLMSDIETIDPDEFFAIEDPQAVAKNGKTAMIDLNHSAGHMRGWGYYNHAQYMTKELLENAGFEVQVNERDLLTAERLESVDLLICNYYWTGWPAFRPYLKPELSAVRQFVEGGGSLLVIGCDRSDGGSNMCTAGNELLRQFGLTFEPGKISKESGMAKTVSGPNIISFEKPVPLQLPVSVQGGDALTLLWFEGEPIVKARQFGQGRVIAAGVGMSFLDCYLADFQNREPLYVIVFYDLVRYLTRIDWKQSCKQDFIEKILSRCQF